MRIPSILHMLTNTGGRMQNPFQSISKVITEIPTKIKPAQEKAEESKIHKPITRFMDETILCPAEDTLNFFNS